MAYNADTMSFELPDTDMIYVSGLPTDITVNEVAEHFGSIGIIKFDKKKDQKKVGDSGSLVTLQCVQEGSVNVCTVLCVMCCNINSSSRFVCRYGCTKTRRPDNRRATAPSHMRVLWSRLHPDLHACTSAFSCSA
jgi:RNA recognition motif-containing protein